MTPAETIRACAQRVRSRGITAQAELLDAIADLDPASSEQATHVVAIALKHAEFYNETFEFDSLEREHCTHSRAIHDRFHDTLHTHVPACEWCVADPRWRKP
ncbi:hypothetical protein ABT234_11665 [Streptomyces sp. NPDC001586]|uniref:hypothetical protein n=1 Tax=Streptomyces sp. NPDC001586 TaxID=3154387 RepID=UPI003329159A